MSLIEDPRSADRLEREAAVVHLLQRVWTYSFTTKSDDARSFADEIIEAAHRQLITTQVVPCGDIYGRLLKLTAKGTALLEANAHMLSTEEASYAQAYCK